MKKPVLIFLAVFIYLLATGLSYLIFSDPDVSPIKMTPTTSKTTLGKITNDYEALTFDPNLPKTESCPLTGVKYGKDQREWWETHSPLGVMIENHFDARPQSGINAADVTYEAVAEGGITRTLNIFYCQDAGIIGPVRSARTYFLDFASEYGENPLYAHVGGANTPGPANALGQIIDYGWNQYNDLNQFSIGYPTFKRDESRLGREVATEHTMYSTTTGLWEVGAKRGLTNKDKNGKQWSDDFVPYSFKDEADLSKRPASQSIHIDFWNGDDYAVDWTYDKKSNTYLRSNGGAPHMDRNTHKQLSAKNIVVLFMAESHANDGYENNAHMLYGDKGTGDALFFMDGKEIEGTWKKADRTSRTELFDADGNEIKFNKGKIWFEIQPLNADVIVK